MNIKNIYKKLIMLACFAISFNGLKAAVNIGFVPDGSNYFKAFPESTDGTIQVNVSNVGATLSALGESEVTIGFYIKVHYEAPNYGTANLSNNDHGNRHMDDYVQITFSETGTSNATNLPVSLIVSSDGNYDVVVDVIQDLRYEGGSGATPETINLYLEEGSSTDIVSVAKDFVYKITDDDQPPTYAFEQTSTQTVQENSWIGSTGRIVPVAHSDGNIYLPGPDDFEVIFTISNGTTVNADHRADGSAAGNVVGSVVVTEWDYHWNGDLHISRDVDHYLTDDQFDEPNETFSITLSENSSSYGDIGTNNTLNFIVEDHVNDLPPYVRFRDADQTVSENGAPQITVVAQLVNAGGNLLASGYDSVSVGYLVTGDALNSGSYADHNLTAGTLTFGSSGDTEQNITFDLIDDAYDEGVDASLFETVIITFDETNVGNTRVDADGSGGGQRFLHTMNIQDDDAAPTMSFSTSTSVTATSGSESVTSPVIKVILDAASGLEITAAYTNNTSGSATIYTDDDTPWDYKINGTTGSGTITIPAYSTEFAIPITINSSEEFDEDNETMKIDFTAGNNVGGGATHTYTIIDDDDTPSLYFTNNATTITSTENGNSNITNGEIAIRLSAPSGKDVNYAVAISSYDGLNYGGNGIDDDGDGSTDEGNEGAAVGGASGDFKLNETTGIVSAYGSGTSSITYTHYGDDTDELDKYIQTIISLASGESDATIPSDGTQLQVIKLADDESAATLSFASGTDNGSEGDAAENVTVSKTGATEFTLKTTISVSNATATDGNTDDDYDLATSGGVAIASGATQVLTFGPSDTDQSISITIDDDDLYEGGASGTPETVEFSIGSYNAFAGAGATETMTYSIIDNEDAPIIEFDTDGSNSVTSGSEAVSSPSITVKTNRRSIFPATINYSAAAKSGTTTLTSDDYTLANGTVEIAALSTSATIPLQILNDSRYEDDETIRITLSSQGANTTIGTALTHDYTINGPNDDKPTLAFSSTVTNDKAESDASKLVRVSLSAISGVQSTVSYTFSGEAEAADYTDATSGAGTLTFAANTDQHQDITINFADDTIDEDTETIIITLSGISGGATNGSDLVHTINLADSDDPPPIGFRIAGESPENSVTIAEGSGATYNPSIVLADGFSTEFDIAVVWSIDAANTDAIIDGETNQDFELRSNGDVALGDYSGLNEAARTVTLAAGQTSVDLLHIDFPADDLFEDSETLVLTLATPTSMSAVDGSGNPVSANGSIITSAAGNATDTKTITITNKSSETVPKVSITETGGGAEANTTANFIATLSSNSGGASKAGKDLYVNYTVGTNGNTQATISSDYTLPDADGSRTFTIPAYASSATKSLTLLDDIIYEYNEDIVIELDAYTTDATAAAVVDAANATYTYTITENDAAPVLEFADADRVAEYAESATARVIDVQFKSSGTQEAQMSVYGYLSVSTDGSKTTAENGVDICETSLCNGSTPQFENYEKITIAPGAKSSSMNFYLFADDRYEASQLVTFELETFTSAEVSGINYDSYPGGLSGSGVPPASNATTDGDEEFAVTISASGADEKPIVQWVDNSGSLPYTASSGSRTIDEGSASSGYFTLQLSKFSEKDITVNYSLITTGELDATGHASTNTYPVDYSYWGTGSDGTGTSTALSTAAGSVTFTGVENNVSATSATQHINIPVALINDDINEWSESITLKIDQTGNDDVTGTGVSDKLVILDDDNPPVVKFTAASSGGDVNEQTIAGSSPSFTFGLYDASGNGTVTGKKIYFSVVTDDADASPGADFIALTNTESDWIYIDAATNLTAQTATVTLDIEDDLIDEEDQEIKITLDVLGADIDGDKVFSSNATGSDERDTDAATDGSPMVHTYTILDDEAVPVLRFSKNSSSIDEGATETITIDFDPESPNIVLSEKEITVKYSVSTSGSDCGSAGGCATGGNSGVYDYLAIGDGTLLTIPAEDTDGTSFSITAVNDSRYESPQDIVIKMDASSEVNATVSGGTGSQQYTLTINDDAADKPNAQFFNTSDIAASSESVDEDNGVYTVTVKLSTISEKDVTIPYSVDFTNSTAIIDDDNTDLTSTAYPSDWRNWDSQVGSTTLSFTAGGASNLHTATGTLTISGAVGTSTATQYEEFIVNITTDDVDEEDETLIFVLDETLTNTNGGGSEFALTITDDDDEVNVQFAASNPTTGAENATDPAFVIELVDASGNQKESGKEVVVNWGNRLGTAEAIDINSYAEDGSVTFTPRTGSSTAAPVTQTVTIDVVDNDATFETNETFTISVLSTTNSSEVGTQDNEYTISNIDPYPKVEFVSSTYTLSEAAGDNGPTIDVGYRIKTGDAANYAELTEEDITVYFKVSSSDDNFGNGNDISTLADYTAGTITANSTDNTITLTATADGLDEANESFNLNMYTYNANQTLSNADVPTQSYAVTDQNSEIGSEGYDQTVITLVSDPNDKPNVSFYDPATSSATSAISVLESDGAVTFSLKLSSVSQKTVTVPYTLTLDYDNDNKTARIGSASNNEYPYDYRQWGGLTVDGNVSGNSVTATGTVDIAAGQDQADITITINNDGNYEFDETINLSIGSPTHASKASANTELVITILNDGEQKTTVEFSSASSSGNEDAGSPVIIPIELGAKSGKDVVLKYSIDYAFNYPKNPSLYFDNDNPSNKNIATKGIDYTFGDTVEKNAAGDSIITIEAGQTTASIPLTIVDDDIDEYNQLLRVSISVINTIADNDAADVGDDSVFTYNIIDEDPEPYILFEPDAAVSESNSGILTKNIIVSLMNESSQLIDSEKIITATYNYDVDADSTSASRDLDGNENVYEDDFSFTNGSLQFTGRTYSYNSADDTFTPTSGETSKTIDLFIYGDVLYEVDETVTIDLTPANFVRGTEKTSGDHSFVYTIKDDDGLPAVSWSGSNLLLEGDTLDANDQGFYMNNDLKVVLSKPSGTDILIEYSLKSETGSSIATEGISGTYDFDLGNDDTDLSEMDPAVNTKSVTIFAATDANSDLFKSVPIKIWNDELVEGSENFTLQIDRYRTKGTDKEFATADDSLISVNSSDYEIQVTIDDNDNPPDAPIVTEIITQTSSPDEVVPDHWNPIRSGYWNDHNSGLFVTVDFGNDIDLINGEVFLIVSKDPNEIIWDTLATPLRQITSGDRNNANYTFDVTKTDFEAANAFGEGEELMIAAILTDNKGNSTRGAKSSTTITIDKTLPVKAYYSIDSVASTGGTFSHKYWNSTNTGFDVIVKVAGIDASVNGGSIIVLAGIGSVDSLADYKQIGDPVAIESANNNAIGDAIKISLTAEQFEGQSGYDEGKIVNFKAQVVDAAGNKAFTNIASTKTVIDTISPKIMSVRSVDINGDAKDGDFGIDSLIRLKFTFSEILKLTAGAAQIEFDDGMISKPEINSAELQWENTITVPFNVQASESSSLLEFKGLTFTNNSSLQDSAGNDMIVFTAEDGSSLEDLSAVTVDGVAPSQPIIDSLFVQGSNSVYGYWNSNSTRIILPILASTQDLSLVGGQVQIQGIVYGDSPLDTVDIGIATVLVEDAANGGGLEPSGDWNNNTQKHYGQISVSDVHFEIDRLSIEAALSSLDNYPDKNAADPEQTVRVGFRAKISDKAGNTVASDTISLKFDEVMPLDPEFGLPTEGYTYRIDTPIDNYEDVIPDTAVENSVSRSGFFNSTNTGIIFKSWIAFDDPNNAITIDRDNSLVDGSVQVQMASSNDVANANWTDIGNPDTIKQSDIDVGYITTTVAKESITSSPEYSEGATVYFRNKVVDKAGNITLQSTVSSKNIIIDTTPLAFANLEYSRKYVNGTDHFPTITAKFDTESKNFPYDPPKLTATINTVTPFAQVTSESMTINTIDGSIDSSSYSFQFDVPGDRGETTFDATVTISLEATDKAGNLILQDVITDKEYLIIDNTSPTVELQYVNTLNELSPINSGKYGDRVEVTAVLSEGMWESPDDANQVAQPSLSVDPISDEITTNIESAKIGIYNSANADFGDSSTVKFEFTLPTKSAKPEFENQDLNLEFLINGTDWAGNPVDATNGYISISNQVFKFDNKAPLFTEFNISDNDFIDTTALDWVMENDALMSSANIRFKPVGDFASPIVPTEGNPIALKDSSFGLFNELSRDFNPPISPYYISNNSSLVEALADSNTYDVIFTGTDLVGNVDSVTIDSVTYDTKHPTVEVAYETKYITALGEKAGTQINLTFNEIQRAGPTIKLYYGAILSQNAEGASWDAADLSTTFIDTSSSNIEGPLTLTNSGDGRTWYYVIDAESVVLPEPSGAFDGYVWVRVFSQDLAGNYLQNNDPASLEFDGADGTDDNFLYLDNTPPTATLTYTNLRDSSMTIYNADNASESYCCFAIAGDSVLIKVEMNEAIVYDASDNSKIPKLDLKYNYIDQDTETNGSTQLGEVPFLITEETLLAGINFKDSIDTDAKTANIFHYKIGIKDGVDNNGTLKLNLNAKDISGTPVTLYGLSPQKSGPDSSQYVLEIDNLHPWGIPGDSIFVEPIDSVTFPTEQFTTTGYRVVENWINRETTHIYVGVPYQNNANDNSLMANNTDWGPQGKIDVQLKNLFGTNEWQTIGSSDTIIAGSPQTVAIGEDYFLRTVSRPVTDFANSASMINQDTTSSNKLQFRGVITDKNGNVTYGQPSDAYSVNSDGFYVSDLLNVDEVGYDIVAPDLGAINDGNFDTEYVFGDTLRIISTDTITISWSEFIDPGDAAASGVDFYEMQVYTYPSWNVTEIGPGQYDADTLGMTDSLFTVDMNLDGIDDPDHWYKIYKEQAPTFNNPITLNTLDSVVTDSLTDTNILYDYNDTLKHELYYMIAIRAFDTAGNASDTIYTNAIQRYNSAPIFIDNLVDLTLYEDIAWDYDTVKVSDLDLSTLQSDSFTYSIFPEKIVPNLAGGFDTNLVLINPPVVDELTGLVSWTPIQDSTLTLEGADTIIDQSGNYLFKFKVEDAYGFKDSINFNATVNAVNDTPIVAILGDDKVLTWQEDKPASEVVKINLSKYVKDIDNLDSEISWQFVIMDTSQLDEDFPLASVIVGPGTPKAVQTKLMRKYMGFDPSMGIDIPTLAKKSGNSTMRMISNADSYISIDIDTSITDSTIAIFTSDSNYHGSNHRIIFSALDPFGALDKDTIIVNILPENDPPVVTAIDTIIINENDSIWVDFSQFTSDVDDTTLTFKIEGVFNTDSINYVSEPYLSDGVGDTVLFDPFDLWSGYANFRVTASDEEAESSQLFTLKVLRVPRPDIQVSLVQNNAFSSYVSIIIVDKEQKTKFLQLEVQNQRIDIDTVASYTYTGDFSFGIGGGYSFDVLAVAEVGKTIYTNTFNLAPARVSNRWYANSSDGRFSVAGDPGSVDTDQSFLIVDSSLFISNFSDQASYVLGEETYMFTKPIEVHFGSLREDLSIYQRENGVIWKELPSINRNGQILTFTENAGYFRLGPKTIIVPEETDLHQNYPNPFNPSTTIKYDIGLMDGIDQRVSVNVYNLAGQHVTTLINNESQVGQFYVKWDGSNKFGKMLPSGIYFVQLKTDTGIIKNKKMMFLK